MVHFLGTFITSSERGGDLPKDTQQVGSSRILFFFFLAALLGLVVS